MEKQLIFKEKYLLKLKAEIKAETSLENYRSNNFVYDKKQVLMMPNIVKPSGLVEKLNVKDDFETAVLLFEAYKNLEPIQAADERFWVYLTHVDLYPYMIKRWEKVHKSISGFSNDYILEHWFFGKGMLRNALAGLWWSVYLSIDEKRGSDKYELTKILFRQLDFSTRTLGSYRLGRHKEAVIGILEFIKENEKLFSTAFEKKTRYITKHLNLVGGVKPISYYDRSFFKSELKKVAANIAAV
jgi:hypothetical protein